MGTRKTISVEQVREWANIRLAAPDSQEQFGDRTPEQAFRLGVASLLEQILFATGNYRGYARDWDRDTEPVCDETRRIYFGPARPLIQILTTEDAQ